MNEVGLAIFVKTPDLSPVKTRLWPRIGQRCAEAFHLASAEAVASVAQRAQSQAPIRAHWAVAEAAAMHAACWSDLPRLHQGEGGLGERMRHIYERLLGQCGAALLIGADAPQISGSCLIRAAQWLRASEARLVIGRAHDGGFWIFGGNRPLPAIAWTSVQYSSPHTARDFLARMAPHGACLELNMLHDVDVFADLRPAFEQLAALTMPTEAQERLGHWISELLAREGVCP